MLVSKIKPCMSQYKFTYCKTANGSLKQLLFTWQSFFTWITIVILELIHASRHDSRRVVLIRYWTNPCLHGFELTHSNQRIACFGGDVSSEFLTYQLPTVGYWPTVAMTGNGELGFDSGEGAWETATTSKEGSRRANYPILTQGGSDKK